MLPSGSAALWDSTVYEKLPGGNSLPGIQVSFLFLHVALIFKSLF
jgi:hypothetical protein